VEKVFWVSSGMESTSLRGSIDPSPWVIRRLFVAGAPPPTLLLEERRVTEGVATQVRGREGGALSGAVWEPATVCIAAGVVSGFIEA
jgi:hypothetical protein